ncbi:hypothetical protein HanXRQr2_Chr11g0478731 [Helianthus annuus]|uniref:Uncharacterized protein n=1 Tax=Helianthus annuus TaxID=4232 RepID=A0A9K3HMC0_HELAN|nr:hypothetical protein HanXRQr2_Chr11g0478731 [Helianthus annuus]KAJ0500707.1 hypothetical protein HanHA300_Chr11g0392421 [Helianthus annuus]KAJ0508302.1 hypothetical protein HanIR_Chr11g0515711 [Helianthus annuus]KAJ0516586.1 hypothetical protein HanHA89_Chr11g0415461 [Helianthus annuus]KAJ0688528.1 hypothetical protein HanOQP8_Chr11g0395291 [Helianthus annuus]
MICRINNPTYVAPENDAWRHENSGSENENEKMSELVEKKIRWWFVKDEKRKRTPKTSPVVPIPTEPAPKIVIKGTSAPTESVKDKEPEGVARDDSSEADDETTETETELDLTTLGRGKAQLKKKSTKKKKGSDEEDSTYTPSVVGERKKLRIKRNAFQTGVIPRNVRARKGGASMLEIQSGKNEKHFTTSKVSEAEKVQSVKVPVVPEVQQHVEEPEVEIQKKGGNDDYVEVNEVRAATPPPPPPPQDLPILEAPESSRSKDKDFSNLFGDLPHATGVYKDDLMLDDDFDVFNNAVVKELEKKVGELEKQKEKAEAEREVLKKKLEELMKENEEIKTVMINQAKKIKTMEDDVEDNTKLFDVMQQEISDMNKKLVKMNEINQSQNQLINELHEALANEFKVMKLEMEAMKADKVIKDDQLNMLYTIMESHLNIDVHAVFNNIEVKRAKERRVERERRLAEEATLKKKSVIEETQEVGGSSRQVDVEMVDAEVDPKGFVLVGESSTLSYDFDDIVRRVHVIQKKKKAKEVLLLRWKDEEVVEEEEDEEEKIDDELFDYIDNFPEGDDDDNDQGSSGLLIVNPSVQQKIEDFLNDEINEQEDDQHQEASTSGKQHVDQVFLTQPTVIYLHARYKEELEVPRSREEMIEELGLDDVKFKFDIEDEIPLSPEREYEFVYAQEADKYNDVIVEDASDSSDE